MKVSLDVTAVPPAPAGAGRYVLELAAALARRAEPELSLIARRDDAQRWRAVVGPRGAVDAAAPGPRPLRLAWEQVSLPGRLLRAGATVHHAPHYTMPERTKLPVVVTVHDCTFFDHPEWHERSKVLVFRRAIRVAARRAAVVVCVSETTARHLRAVVPVAGEVIVVPHGVDHDRFTPDASSEQDGALLRRAGVDPGRPYVLFVGTVEPRKDVASLVSAFAQVADQDPEPLLVIAGRRGWKEQAVDAALAAASRHRERIVCTGYVPDECVPALLRTAAVAAYPSLAEGYGLPALEALACGTPLVTTAGTAMAELAGDAAVLVPPADPEALAAALAGALASGRRDAAVLERRRLGLSLAAARTWDDSAAGHVVAYRHAHGA
jgi:glycosyltransferase involved in cell wall biosynthesis